MNKKLLLSFLFCVTVLSGNGYGQAGCQCNNKIYLNDEERNLTHKFDVAANGAMVEISGQGGPGTPWLAPGIINSPHGLATDESGNIFIGQADAFVNGQVVGPVFEIACDGTVLETDVISPFPDFNFNVASRNGVLYNPDPGNNRIEAFDECSGLPIGFIQIDPNLPPFSVAWGFHTRGDTWYLTERTATGNVYTGSLDPSLYNFTGNNSGSILFPTNQRGIFNQIAAMGLTTDEDGNIYMVFNTLDGGGAVAEVRKYSPTGAVITNAIDNTNPGAGNANAADGLPGFYGARGIVYSETSGYLYVSNFENCVTVFDTDLNELPQFNIGNPTNGKPKGIGIAFECCPGSALTTIDTTVCIFEPGQVFDLSDLINCDGAFCEGEWTEVTGNDNIDYDTCKEELTLNGNGCATFRSTSNGGPGTTCGPATVILNICSTPVNCGDFLWDGQ